MVDTLNVYARCRLKQRHQLRLQALAAIEKRRRVDVNPANFVRVHTASAHQPVSSRESERQYILFVAANTVVLNRSARMRSIEQLQR